MISQISNTRLRARCERDEASNGYIAPRDPAACLTGMPQRLNFLKMNSTYCCEDWIIVISLWTQLLSYIVGIVFRKLFSLPQWVVPCLIFINVTSLPLFLLGSLKSQGVLDGLARKDESARELIMRRRTCLKGWRTPSRVVRSHNQMILNNCLFFKMTNLLATQLRHTERDATSASSSF